MAKRQVILGQVSIVTSGIAEASMILVAKTITWCPN